MILYFEITLINARCGYSNENRPWVTRTNARCGYSPLNKI